jgi:hypothetical protein
MIAAKVKRAPGGRYSIDTDVDGTVYPGVSSQVAGRESAAPSRKQQQRATHAPWYRKVDAHFVIRE